MPQEKGMKKAGDWFVSASGYVMVNIQFDDPDKREFTADWNQPSRPNNL